MALKQTVKAEKIRTMHNYIHTIFRHSKPDNVDLELYFRYDNGELQSKIFRVDRLGLDRLVLDLQIEQHILDGKTLEQATKLVEDF